MNTSIARTHIILANGRNLGTLARSDSCSFIGVFGPCLRHHAATIRMKNGTRATSITMASTPRHTRAHRVSGLRTARHPRAHHDSPPRLDGGRSGDRCCCTCVVGGGRAQRRTLRMGTALARASAHSGSDGSSRTSSLRRRLARVRARRRALVVSETRGRTASSAATHSYTRSVVYVSVCSEGHVSRGSLHGRLVHSPWSSVPSSSASP